MCDLIKFRSVCQRCSDLCRVRWPGTTISAAHSLAYVLSLVLLLLNLLKCFNISFPWMFGCSADYNDCVLLSE